MSLLIPLPHEKFEKLRKLHSLILHHKIEKMSLESLTNINFHPFHIIAIIAPVITNVGKDRIDYNLSENQVIRNAKIDLENFRVRPKPHDLFYYYCHSDTSSDSSNIFSIRDPEVWTPSSTSFFTLFFAMCPIRPPEIFLNKFQLYRRVPYCFQWICVIIVCYFKFPMFCWKKLRNFVLACIYFPCTCWEKFSKSRGVPESDPENPPDYRTNLERESTSGNYVRPQGYTNYGADAVIHDTVSRSPNHTEPSKIHENGLKNHNPSGNNEPRPSTPPKETVKNNKPAPTSISIWNEFESSTYPQLETEDPIDPDTEQDKKNVEEYVKQLEAIRSGCRKYDEEHKKRMEELETLKQQQEERHNSLKYEQPPSDSEFEEARKMKQDFDNHMEEQNRRHEEEIEEIRRKRREQQEEWDREFLKMKKESQQRLSALLQCIRMRLRFEEKEEEWGDFLKSIRGPLIKITNYYYDVQNEFRKPADVDDVKFILAEIRFFAKLVYSGQETLADAYDYLEGLSEEYDDRIFLKMIMKSISVQGEKCDAIGKALLKLSNSPLHVENQKECDKAVAELDAHAIPTTDRLKKDSTNTRTEDFEDMNPSPYPEWFQSFSYC
ncbi:hypothetical protein L3Y34_007458 [Caenorhabditis briggsae]|uniref:Uncharacterized protein n=1 Tax=Caenorhabditis briggsae TaxID=6238 RepID=A0AAE9D0X0_CAEBR|nr:hypothetical protein L3Y34_007458 [Caenorhabditis briggsae]